jgi:integrase
MRGSSRRPPDPARLRALLDAAPADDRAVWSCLVLTGVRRGELRGLRWTDVDFDEGVLHVEQQFQPGEGSSRRRVAGTARCRWGRRLPPICGRTDCAPGAGTASSSGNGDRPLDTGQLQDRADTAWEAHNDEARERATEERRDVLPAELVERVTPHVCRHFYATSMAAAGVSLHALSRYMGQSSIDVTWSNYGNLFPGEEAQAATLQEAFLARAFDSAVVGAGS